MYGEKIISRLKKLNEIETIKEITPLTNYMFPGSHCPLMGATMAVRGINGAMVMVVGTDECAYYNKSSMGMSEAFGGIGGRCVSVVLDTHDVTFGSVEKVEKAFAEMYEEYQPTCVFMVTTCVIEIIGDDFDSLCLQLTDDYKIPVMSVHTEHFKSQDHLPGIERTLTSCASMMKKCERDGSVNVLGQRLGDFTETELYSVLSENGVKIGMMLPSGCDIDDVISAPKAQVNVVVNNTALPLAKKMKAKFKVPYVYFERMADPDNILKSYKELFEFLEMEMPNVINEKYESAKNKCEEMRKDLNEISYIYGNTPFVSFELNAFMAKLGMKPLLIQLSYLTEEDKIFKNMIEETHNPYVTRTANIAPLQYVYDVLKPNLYLGHEYAVRLKKKGIAIVHSDRASSMLGFEVTEYILEELHKSALLSLEYKKELEKEIV